MVLEPIYEQSFHDFSYGFRPEKSQHQALQRLREGLTKNKGGWVIDLDIRKFLRHSGSWETPGNFGEADR